MKVPGEISKSLLNVKVTLFPNQRLEKKKKAGKIGVDKSLQKPGKLESLLEKVKTAYINNFEKNMTALTYAEADEFDIAKDILVSATKDEKTERNILDES